MEEFQCKTTIYSGPGAVSALAGMGGQRLMLVTDPFFMKNGTAQRIAQTAKCAQVEYFDKVQPDPSVELAAEGTARLKEFAPDLLSRTNWIPLAGQLSDGQWEGTLPADAPRGFIRIRRAP